jgi:predicted aspartyl protease
MPDYSSAFQPPAPWAEVTVSVPGTARRTTGVPMLLDTGADVTLLPRSVVEALNPPGESTLLLRAFDQAVIERPAYDLVVTFLNGNFRDDFAMTDAAIGVLGRNILNFFHLTFHSPTQQWEAH